MTNVTEADDINHVVVFLTGSQPFPNEMGGAGMSFPNVVQIFILFFFYCIVFVQIKFVVHSSMNKALYFFNYFFYNFIKS